MKMRDDDGLYFIRFDSQLREQSRRLDEICPLSPFRCDIVGIVSRIDDDGSMGSLDEPKNIRTALSRSKSLRNQGMIPRTPPVFTDPHHQRVD